VRGWGGGRKGLEELLRREEEGGRQTSRNPRWGREGGKEGRREGGKEGRREGGKEGRREGGKEGRREGGKENTNLFFDEHLDGLIDISGYLQRVRQGYKEERGEEGG
jgi:hypothetical protein